MATSAKLHLVVAYCPLLPCNAIVLGHIGTNLGGNSMAQQCNPTSQARTLVTLTAVLSGTRELVIHH